MSLERFDVAPRLSQAVKAGGLVFTAGVFAPDATQDVTGQTRQVLAKIDDLLSRAGTDKSKLVSATIYIPEMALFAGMNTVVVAGEHTAGQDFSGAGAVVSGIEGLDAAVTHSLGCLR